MTIITDGGSTKCDWVLLDAMGEVIFKTTTPGLNPTVVNKEELHSRILQNKSLKEVFHKIKTLDFYGAGCGTVTPRNILKIVLNSLFPFAEVTVSEDLAAAVFAVTNEPGIVCILGTGSNSCYFDGKEIHAPIPALGYALMDEASGNYFEKRLIRDYYYNRMPANIASEFSLQHNLKADNIKMKLYTEPNPTAYLASFAQFICSQEQRNPYFYQLIKDGILNFMECRILSFENAHQVPVHFIGYIAHFSKDIIADCFKENNLILGNIVQRPIDGLVEHYKRNILA